MFNDAINLSIGAPAAGGPGAQPGPPTPRDVSKPPPDPVETRPPEMSSPAEFSFAGIPRSTPSLSFQRDASGEMYISVIDRESGKELRQIPPEELRQLAESLEKWTGNVFDALA